MQSKSLLACLAGCLCRRRCGQSTSHWRNPISVKFQHSIGQGRQNRISLTLSRLIRVAHMAAMNMDALENNPQRCLILGLSFVPSSTFSMETQPQRCVHGAPVVNITHWGTGRAVSSRLRCNCNPVSKSAHDGFCLLHHAVCSTGFGTGELQNSSEDPHTSHAHGSVLPYTGGRDLTNSDLPLEATTGCLKGSCLHLAKPVPLHPGFLSPTPGAFSLCLPTTSRRL